MTRNGFSNLLAFVGTAGLMASIFFGGADRGGWYVLTAPVCAFFAGYGACGMDEGRSKR